MTKDKCDGEVKRCCSTLHCKSTAALQEQVEAEMQEQDQSLKALLNGKTDADDSPPSD